ncbi:MAG: hypothetical protein ACRD4P_18505 [Bryobacteraceae bacterium]
MDVNELNPSGKDLFTHLFPSLIDDYKFKTYPTPGQDFKDGMKFTGGEFVKEDGTVIALNVTVYNNGISADTFSSTKDSEDFLKEVLDELPQLGFAFDEEMIRRKDYNSQLTIKCSGRLEYLNPKLLEFANRLSSASDGIKFDTSAIELWPDQTILNKPVNFSFQRKSGDPSNGDRYWSQAGVPTDIHLKLLEELEVILSKPGER